MDENFDKWLGKFDVEEPLVQKKPHVDAIQVEE